MRILRYSRLLIATALAGGAAAAAGGGSYTPTDWIALGDATLGASGFEQYQVPLPEDGVLGFEVRFDYSETIRDDSWASDLQVVVVAPTGGTYTVGGQTNLPIADSLWSFQGDVSDGPGRYGDDGKDIFLPWKEQPITSGLWTIVFRNDWATDPNANNYDDIHVRFYVLDLPACPEDVDGDEDIGFGDVLRVLANWGPCEGCPEDIDENGEAGFGDVLRILAQWGPCD